MGHDRWRGHTGATHRADGGVDDHPEDQGLATAATQVPDPDGAEFES